MLVAAAAPADGPRCSRSRRSGASAWAVPCSSSAIALIN